MDFMQQIKQSLDDMFRGAGAAAAGGGGMQTGPSPTGGMQTRPGEGGGMQTGPRPPGPMQTAPAPGIYPCTTPPFIATMAGGPETQGTTDPFGRTPDQVRPEEPPTIFPWLDPGWRVPEAPSSDPFGRNPAPPAPDTVGTEAALQLEWPPPEGATNPVATKAGREAADLIGDFFWPDDEEQARGPDYFSLF
jgi:hypothetical protein